MRHKYFLRCFEMKMLLQIGWLCLYDVIDGREKCFPLTQIGVVPSIVSYTDGYAVAQYCCVHSMSNSFSNAFN